MVELPVEQLPATQLVRPPGQAWHCALLEHEEGQVVVLVVQRPLTQEV